MTTKNNNKNNKNIFFCLFGNTSRGLVASCVQICTGEKTHTSRHIYWYNFEPNSPRGQIYVQITNTYNNNKNNGNKTDKNKQQKQKATNTTKT